MVAFFTVKKTVKLFKVFKFYKDFIGTEIEKFNDLLNYLGLLQTSQVPLLQTP